VAALPGTEELLLAWRQGAPPAALALWHSEGGSAGSLLMGECSVHLCEGATSFHSTDHASLPTDQRENHNVQWEYDKGQQQ